MIRIAIGGLMPEPKTFAGSTTDRSAFEAGGKVADRVSPVCFTGRVLAIHDGRYDEDLPRHGGIRHNDQGLTAVLTPGLTAANHGRFKYQKVRRPILPLDPEFAEERTWS